MLVYVPTSGIFNHWSSIAGRHRGDGEDEQVIEVTDDGRNMFLFATKL